MGKPSFLTTCVAVIILTANLFMTMHAVDSTHEVVVTADGLDTYFEWAPPGTIHFLFLLTDGLPHISIWRNFFSAAKGDVRYASWAHCENFTACAANKQLRDLGIKLVPSVVSKRCLDLVSPEVQVLKYALEQPGSSQDKFILLSDSSLPVKPLPVIYNTLMKRTTTDMCFFPMYDWPDAEIEGADLLLPKTAQWAIFTGAHARALVRRWAPSKELFDWNMTYQGRQLQAKPFYKPVSKQHSKCADEVAVFATIFGPVDEATAYQGFEHFGVSATCDTLTLFHWPSHTVPVPERLIKAIAEDPNTRTDGIEDAMKAGGRGSLASDLVEGIKNGITGHPKTFLLLGNVTMHALRSSVYLFARKFATDAEFHGFEEVLFDMGSKQAS
eukprot:TRINITY_DN11469_c0_g1_i1.p1 TRINITY_DN11469_c0_g1~~TRINITY_DN11469_c0_g1_i1.p1  ORF type:complete len:385 (-),score=46.60 TRINITY_DN11469_c0_g1_i1:79-1233(-)